MNEDEARRLLLVRAVEIEDAAEAVLTREDRRQATVAALAEPARRDAGRAPDGVSKADEAFLVRRAEFASTRIATRFPAAAQVSRNVRWPTWIDWLLPVGALALGAATNEIDAGRLNIIAFPLVGMLVWNFAVYALLIAGWLRGLAPGPRYAARPNLLARLVERSEGLAGRRLDVQTPLGRALARFVRDWLRYSSKLTYSRASRTLHLSAAALAAGVLLGMYMRALGVEYRAGWESTFIGAGTLSRFLGLVLGPASALTGIPLPGPGELEGIRWTDGNRGENAGPWIHLYATTALIFIIGPRLLLAAWNALAAFRLRRRFPVPGTEDFYVRRLLRSARGHGAVVRVTPYSFHPPEATQRQLQGLLTEILGDETRVTVDTPLPYGGEDEWLARANPAEDADHLLVLFNLSSTPEAENHGALVAGLQRRLAQDRSGAGLTVLLEESAYRRRLGGQAGAEDRIATRRLAWETMLRPLGVAPLAIDLSDENASALARRLEDALIKSPALVPEARTA